MDSCGPELFRHSTAVFQRRHSKVNLEEGVAGAAAHRALLLHLQGRSWLWTSSGARSRKSHQGMQCRSVQTQ